MEKMAASESSIGKEAECEDFVINIPSDLAPSIERPECIIYRVPKQLRKQNKEAYTPKLASIGPFHYRRKELRDMEIHKLRYLRDFLNRTGKSQKDLLKIIKDNEVKIRHCYSEECRLNSKDFVRMILLDSIFIIELFLKDRDRDNDKSKQEEAERKGKKEEDEKCYIQSRLWLELGIFYDLILLENQLPFFVLEKLYMLASNNSSSSNNREEGKEINKNKNDPMKQDSPFVKLSRHYFKRYDQLQKAIIGEEVKHFTDLVRYLFCSVRDLKPRERMHNVYSATKLDDTGLKFKVVEERRLLDVKLARNKCLELFPCFNLSWLLACLPCLEFPCLESMQCVLEVPPIVIDDYTEAVFRNLIALEQCLYQRKAYICNYAALLDNLIDTEEDVKFLVHEKVIVNNIGSNAAVATLINKLCLGIVEDQSCYAVLVKQIDRYSNNPWSRIMATMKSVYFRDFWRGTATLVGLVILISQFRDLLRFLH